MNKVKKFIYEHSEEIWTVAVTGLSFAGLAGLVYLGYKRAENNYKSMNDLVALLNGKTAFVYVPFEDLTKEEAINLMQGAVDGTIEIADAQIVDGNQTMIFLNNPTE